MSGPKPDYDRLRKIILTRHGWQAGMLVQRLELLAHFPGAVTHSWFESAVAHLETYRTARGTYVFPSRMMREGSSGYWVTGRTWALARTGDAGSRWSWSRPSGHCSFGRRQRIPHHPVEKLRSLRDTCLVRPGS
ncbi:MAG: hypothetical protein Q8P50_07555 [Bacillota bacterium]|nr:hypothetical protein [Bacillota bacterium]